MSDSSNIGYHLHSTLTMNYQIIKIKHSEIIGTYIAMLTPVMRKQNTVLVKMQKKKKLFEVLVTNGIIF